MMDVYLWVMYVKYVNCWAFLNMCLLCSICTEQHFSSETDCLLGDPPYTLASNHRSAQCQQNRLRAATVEAFQPGRPSSVCFRAGTMLSTFCQRRHHGPALGDLANPRKKMDIWVVPNLSKFGDSSETEKTRDHSPFWVARIPSLRLMKSTGNPNSVDKCPWFCLFIAKLHLANPQGFPFFSFVLPFFQVFSPLCPCFPMSTPSIPPGIGTCSLKALSVSQAWGLEPSIDLPLGNPPLPVNKV